MPRVALQALERRSQEMREEMEQEIESVRKSFRAEIVPYRQMTDLVHRPRPEPSPGARRIRVDRD